MSANNDDDTLWPKKQFFYDDALIKQELIDNILEKSLKEQYDQEYFRKQFMGEWMAPAGKDRGAIDYSGTTASQVMELKDKIQRLERQVRDMERHELRRKVEDQDEELLRVTHPSVQDAWEKYQIVLRLAKNVKVR